MKRKVSRLFYHDASNCRLKQQINSKISTCSWTCSGKFLFSAWTLGPYSSVVLLCVCVVSGQSFCLGVRTDSLGFVLDAMVVRKATTWWLVKTNLWYLCLCSTTAGAVAAASAISAAVRRWRWTACASSTRCGIVPTAAWSPRRRPTFSTSSSKCSLQVRRSLERTYLFSNTLIVFF